MAEPKKAQTTKCTARRITHRARPAEGDARMNATVLHSDVRVITAPAPSTTPLRSTDSWGGEPSRRGNQSHTVIMRNGSRVSPASAHHQRLTPSANRNRVGILLVRRPSLRPHSSFSPTSRTITYSARWTAFLVVLTWGAQAPAPPAQPRSAGRVYTPAAGTPERKAILNALRQHLHASPAFKVAFVAISGTHAFVRAGEVVRDGGALQETDLFIEALLVKHANAGRARWTVLALWNLSAQPTGEEHRAFLIRVHRIVQDKKLPATLLPVDLRPAPRP